MKIWGILLLAIAAVTVNAKHRKEWQKVDLSKLIREKLTFSEKPDCSRGEGFYRDPQDCHQFIRCVDDYGNGRHFSVFVGRCEPGLVFDENVSACNWPELAAPCSSSPPKLQEVRKPLKPEQVPADNKVHEKKVCNKPHPDQQRIIQETDVKGTYQPQQEVPVVQEIQIAAQEPLYEDKPQQISVETEKTDQQVQEQIQENVQAPAMQEEIYQEKVQEPEIQEQVYQENIRVPEIQEEIYQEKVQEPEIQEEVYQENIQPSVVQGHGFQEVQAFEEPAQNEQNIIQSEQAIYQEQNSEINISPGQQPSNGFQQIVDQETQRFEVPQQAQLDKFPQQSQSEWWVPEEKPQFKPPATAEHIPFTGPNQQPFFCSQEGFYRHPENCSQFIRCVQIGGSAFAVHFFECPKQLVFNERDSACISAENDSCQSHTRKKRQASNPKLKCRGEGFFRHPEDCRSFYRCVKTETGYYETHHFSCPANLVFDEEYTTCNWPEKAPPCDSQQQFKPTRKPVKPVQTERTTYKPQARRTSAEPSSTTNKRSRSTPKPRNDFIDKSLVEELFSNRRSTEKPRATTQSYERGTKCRSPGFFSNDVDCTKFYKCVKKGNRFIRYELACPKNFAYDDALKKCVTQRYANSCNRNKPPYPPRQDDEESTASPEATSSANSASGNDASACEREGYFRNPEDCNKFYRCVDFNGNGEEFVRYDFKCPEELVFDEENSVCNWPDQSAPCDTRGGGGEGTGDKDEATGGNENEENGDRGSENEASTTSEPSSTRSVETSSASVDDNEENESNKPDDSGSENESGGTGSENECTKEGFYRNPEDCNKFYRCVDFNGEGKEFVRYDFNCPEGLVFDEANSVCNWPSDSEPCDTRSGGGNEGDNDQDKTRSTTSKTPSREDESSDDNRDSSQSEQTTPSGSESSESAPDSSSSSGSNEDNSQSSTESPNKNTTGSKGSGSNGECTEEGFYRNPEDCNKFYRCVDQHGNGEFIKYDFTCPEGLVFDEVNSVCNWPDQSAPCDGGDSGREKSSTSGDNGSESSQGTTSSSRSSTESEGAAESTASSTTEKPKSTDRDDTSSTTERSTNTSPGNGGSESTSDNGSRGNQGECTEEGFYRNPEDCNKFYRCVDFNGDGQEFVRYDFECPEGLVFDEVNSVCNWPDQSAKCETKSDSDGNQTSDSGNESSTSQTESSSEKSQSSTEETTRSSTEQSTSDSKSGDSSECEEPGFYRCKDDCSKFYRCVEEDGKLVRYDFKCPDGLIFDDKNKKCDWPSSELKCETDSTDSTTTTASYESSSTQSATSSSESSNKECTEEGFFRNPDDCSKYYRCIDEGDGTFTREDFSCAEDEVFDEEMRYCNRKDLAPPCDGSSESQSTSSSGTSSESQSTTEKSSTQSPTDGSTKSSSECTEPGFFRCPEDCTKFYRCVQEDENSENLVRYDFQCPDGLIFDEKNKKCDWPSSELTCDTESSTSPSTTNSQTSGTTSQSSSSGTTSSSSGATNDCTEEGFFRNPDDCSKYYRCIDEGDGTFTREDFACEEDEVFDEEMRYCNRKDLAPPCDNTSSATDSSTSTTSSSEKSASESTSGTTSGSSGSGECEEEGFHRDPNDCNKFYRCVDFQGDGQSFTRYDFECPEGLVFDESNDVCNWPSSVPSCESGNESRGSTGSSSSTESSSAQTSDSSVSSTTAAQTSSTAREQTSTTPREQTSTTASDRQSTSSTQESSSNTNEAATSSESGTTSSGGTGSRGGGSSDNIECTEEGFFRHPEDCSKFYRCVDFAGTGESYVRYDFDCPEGLVFDEVNSVCNWPNMSPGCENGSRGGSDNNESDNKNSENSSTDSSSSTSGSSSSDTSTDENRTTSSTTTRDQTTRSSTSATSSDEFHCEEEGFFKHPTDCKKYYECKRDEETGELIKIDCECPDGQVWDNEGWYCNAEDLSPPCDSGSSSSSFRCTEEGFFRDPEDCTKYYQCNRTGPGENDFSTEKHQCDDGLVFDEEGRYCNAPELSKPCDDSSSSSGGTTASESSRGSTGDGSSGGTTSGGSSSNQGECTSEGFFRNPEDCAKYYQCTRNEETGDFDRSDYTCPDGRIFDEGSNYCNDPELSEQPCESGSSSESPTSRQAGTESSSTDGGSRGGSSTSSAGTRSGGNPECTQEGFFRHPDDCNKFYRCVDFSGSGESFVRYDFDCPEGLHFDEVNSVCNWPTMTPPCESNNRSFLSNRAV